MILCDHTLRAMLPQFILNPGTAEYSHINPASIDLRIGRTLRTEKMGPIGLPFWEDVDLTETSKDNPCWLAPGQFALVATEEYLLAPNGYALELRLKSSRAREGYDHSLAFWFDPGWRGIGTMEIKNALRFSKLPLYRGLRFGQMIVNCLDSEAENPYHGKYQDAQAVEASKDKADGPAAVS